METRGMFTCRDGWHVVARAGEFAYVRAAARLYGQRGTYAYRVGPVPDDGACETIRSAGDEGMPWTCSACGSFIWACSANPFQPTRRRSWRLALVEPFLSAVDPDGQLDRRTRQRHATLAMRAYYARI
jgi:hypothetical protein